MNRTLLIRVSAGILFLGASWVAYTQNQGKQAPQLTLNKVKDDLYEIEGDGGNVAVYITDEGVILVDDKFDQDHDAIVEKVKSVTNQPIKYILSTHYHADHSGGNAKFLGTAQIISTANARNAILQHKQSNAPPGVMPASVVFTKESDLFLGGKEVRAMYLGRGHTNGDAVIYFPLLKVIHTGDLMAGTSPLIDYDGGGSLTEWTATLDEALKLDFDTVIPGHGSVGSRNRLVGYRNNVQKMHNRVSSLVLHGMTQPELAKFMETEYQWAPGSLNQQWSVPGMMKELKQ